MKTTTVSAKAAYWAGRKHRTETRGHYSTTTTANVNGKVVFTVTCDTCGK